MADRQTRRTLKRTRNTAQSGVGTVGDGSSVAGTSEQQPRTVPNSDRDTNTSERKPDNEPNEPVSSRARVIEIDPNQLGELIRNDTGNSDGNSDGSDTGERKRRTYTRRTSKKEAPKNVDGVMTMLHMLLAGVSKCPEFVLDPDEAKQYAEAYTEYAKHHDIEMLSDKRMSEVMLIGTVIMINGPRLIAIRNRWKQEAAERKPNVTPINTAANVSKAF